MREPVATMLRRGIRSPGIIALVVSAITLVTVHADSSPSPGQPTGELQRLIFGCANTSTGVVRVVVPPPINAVPSPDVAPMCGDGEKPIAWNQAGRPGPSGSPGATGADGKQGPAGKDQTIDVASLRDPFGILIAPSLADIRQSLAALQQPLPGGVTGLAEFISDNGSFEVPAGITHVMVEAWGGGGGGSGASDASNANQSCIGGAGGGAGGYVRAIVPISRPAGLKPTDKLTLSVHVGPGGKGGASGAGGDTGSASTVSLGQTVLVTAGGGGGGTSASQSAPGGTGGMGGAGSAPNSTPIVRIGGSGLHGTTTSPARPPVVLGLSAQPPARPAPAPLSDAGLTPLERVLKALGALERQVPRAQQPPVLPRNAAPADQQPANSDICGLGGAGGMPVRGSIDPLGTNGGRGGDQTSSESRTGDTGGTGYVLILW